jgi:uncharacterized protein (TIGR03067 family)
MMTEEDQGRDLPEEELQERFRLVVEGDKWTLKENNGPEMKEWNDKIDSTKSPKEGDFTYLFGSNKDNVSLAIYELDGDTLRLCIAEPGESRPSFRSHPDHAGAASAETCIECGTDRANRSSTGCARDEFVF